jgi:hypothetical protein
MPSHQTLHSFTSRLTTGAVAGRCAGMHLHTQPLPGRGTRALAAALTATLLAGCVIPPTRHPYRYGPPPVAPAPAAPPMYFYPERGQPEAQQDRDRYECYRLAVRDSGVDPGMTPVSRALVAPAAAGAPRRRRRGRRCGHRSHRRCGRVRSRATPGRTR